MSDITLKAPTSNRLQFIDMARSIAIILMLEGHFVDDSLMDVFRDMNNPIFSTWLFIRGFTAPIFLTVTGLVFVYLLLMKNDEPFFSNLRVKKGFKRSVELYFWGFILQYYAFHVLQCIGVGIFTILLIYGLYKLIKVIPLWVYYLFAGLLLFGLNMYFDQLEKFQVWPEQAPKFIQNMFHGPRNRAIFPIVPWMGYTMFGAFMGCLLHVFKGKIKRWSTTIITMVIGLTLFLFSKEILVSLDTLFNHPFTLSLARLDWLYMRLGMVIMVLTALLMVELLLGNIKENLFMKMGQNTLTIYILHMIVLYGSITGLGLNKLFHKSLGPWEVTIGAILFVTFFMFLIKYLDQIKAKLEFILGPIRRLFNKIFMIPS